VIQFKREKNLKTPINLSLKRQRNLLQQVCITKGTRPLIQEKMKNTVSDTHTLEFLGMDDQFVADATSYRTHNRCKRRIFTPSSGLKPTTPRTEWLQTHDFHSTATRTGPIHDSCVQIRNHSNIELLMDSCCWVMLRSHIHNDVRQIETQIYP
jgi:hypothetical protein